MQIYFTSGQKMRRPFVLIPSIVTLGGLQASSLLRRHKKLATQKGKGILRGTLQELFLPQFEVKHNNMPRTIMWRTYTRKKEMESRRVEL
jgi:hypothetical protein